MTSEALKPILSEPVEWNCGDPDVAAYRIAKKFDARRQWISWQALGLPRRMETASQNRFGSRSPAGQAKEMEPTRGRYATRFSALNVSLVRRCGHCG